MAAHPLNDFYYYELNWCGCGDPEQVMTFMRDVLEAMRKRSDENSSIDYADRDRAVNTWSENSLLLKRLVDDQTPIGLSYLYMLDGLSLTEHGGYIGGSWLTPKGRALLGLMQNSDLGLVFSEYDYGMAEKMVLPPYELPPEVLSAWQEIKKSTD